MFIVLHCVLRYQRAMDGAREGSTETEVRYYRTKRCDIVFLHFIMEACDGVATVSTVNPEEGIVRIASPVSRVEEVALLLRALEKEIEMEYLPGTNEYPAWEIGSIKGLA